MRKEIFGCILIGIGLLLTACNGNTYSRLRDKEDKLIANYISRNNLQIVTEEPGIDHVWGEKEFYKVKGYDNFYFHLISRGDSVRYDTINATQIDTPTRSVTGPRWTRLIRWSSTI